MQFTEIMDPDKNYLAAPKYKADRNLTYLQFIALVKYLWAKAHPDIPIKPTQPLEEADLPVIIYGIEIRRPMSNEPKMRFREQVINKGGQSYLIHGQRFQNIVSFSVIHTDPMMADQIIEVFEDFMLEYTPVFKQLGASEFVYSRRTPDGEVFAHGEDMIKRTVAYMLTTEKILMSPMDLLESVLIDCRIWIDRAHILIDPDATPSNNITQNIIDTEGHATPLT